MLDEEFTLTKRHLGLLMVAGGAVLGGLMLVADLVRDQPGGFGTLQTLGVWCGVMSILIGLTLLPLGDRPV